MADPELERTVGYVSETDGVLSVLILCPCGQQLEAESRWWFSLACPGCQARYEFGVLPTVNLRSGESRRIRVSVLRE